MQVFGFRSWEDYISVTCAFMKYSGKLKSISILSVSSLKNQLLNIFPSQIPPKGQRIAKRPKSTARSETDRSHLSRLLRGGRQITGMQSEVEQPCQAKQTGAVAHQFVTMQCTCVCLCATGGGRGGRGEEEGLVWCISLCLHDRISYMITKPDWLNVTGAL